MDFYHDVHDWLGGYPYEAALAPEIDEHMVALGFNAERVFARSKPLGLFGSGCDEYVYRRRTACGPLHTLAAADESRYSGATSCRSSSPR